MVNWWFGSRWFGILGVPLSNNPFPKFKGIPQIQTTRPQTTKLNKLADRVGFVITSVQMQRSKLGITNQFFRRSSPKGTCLYGKGIYLKLFIVYV